MKAALAQKFTDFKLEFDKNIVDKIIPDPESITFLRYDEPL